MIQELWKEFGLVKISYSVFSNVRCLMLWNTEKQEKAYSWGSLFLFITPSFWNREVTGKAKGNKAGGNTSLNLTNERGLIEKLTLHEGIICEFTESTYCNIIERHLQPAWIKSNFLSFCHLVFLVFFILKAAILPCSLSLPAKSYSHWLVLSLLGCSITKWVRIHYWGGGGGGRISVTPEN